MFKSIKTSVLALVLVATAIIAHAQKKVTEGTLVYKMKYKVDMPGAPLEQKTLFNGDVSMFEMYQGPAKISVYMDNKSGTGLLLIDVAVAQKQFAAKLAKTDMEEMSNMRPKYSDFVATGEKKMIGDYNTEKYTFKDDKGGVGELWATTDIEIPVNISTADFKDIKGTPVLIESPTATVTLASVKEGKVGELSVTKIPSGYEEVTYADMKAMRGGR